MRIIVVGAGGILAPAAAALAARGDDVTGVATTPDGIPDGVAPLVADGHDPSTFSGSAWDAGVVYLPAVTDASLAALTDAVAGPLVRVAVSAAADPGLGSFELQPSVLQLGWSEAGGWHSPAQISAAALEVLADGHGRLLGAVRPWRDRPV